jgi:hypothetical protein
MRARRYWVAVLAFSCSLTSQAREWEKVPVPGTHCGDGSGYSVFVSRKDPRRIAFDVMGGGACWSLSTCIGPTPLAWTHAIPLVLERDGFVSENPARSPVADHTIVYFPYCTGDVHLGAHVAEYRFGVKVHHVGRLNFERTLHHLVENRIVDLPGADRFVLYGYSAGSIGALVHLPLVDRHLSPEADKVMIADAPGLHFGPDFWDRFTPAQVRDFGEAMASFGVSPRSGEGNLAYLAPEICRRHRDWRFGFLQGSKDWVMAALFGQRDFDEHEAVVYGPAGLFTLTEDPADNCASWIPRTMEHTFLVTGLTARIRASTGMSAMDFARRIIQGESAGTNIR